jgi:DNA-binding CsgD family transcriptional regulator
VIHFTKAEDRLIRCQHQHPRHKELAVALGVSIHTIKHQLSTIFQKVGCDNRLGLLVWSIKNGFVEIERTTEP